MPADESLATKLRAEMVQRQLRQRGIMAERVLRAMLDVPRHAFVPEVPLELAYADQPLPIGEGQTISQPFMVAAMAEALELRGMEKVLDVGTGSGYSAAVLSLLAREVCTVERFATFASRAELKLKELGFQNVHMRVGDGSAGWPDAAPFDAISVAAAAPHVPQPIIDQLAEGGRLVIPVGDAENQQLVVVQKSAGVLSSRSLHHCRFVPLTGTHGFSSL